MSISRFLFKVAAIAICTVGMLSAAAIVCQKLFEKNYLTVSEVN